MDGHSDASSAIEVESNPLPAAPWSNKSHSHQAQRERTTRRKRKPMSAPQASHISRRCNNCGVTKTPQWREGPDGPKTLCNACGVKYSRERQDKSKSRKSRKIKPKTGIKSSATKLSYSSSVTTKKRTRNAVRDRQSYDFTFFVSSSSTATTTTAMTASTTNPSPPMPKMAKIASGAVPGFTGKEYAAALSLVSLAILGTTSSVDTHAPSSVHDEEGDLTPPQAQAAPPLHPPKTRRSKRIARRSCSQYYGGLDTNDWIQHLLEDIEEGTHFKHPHHHQHRLWSGVQHPCEKETDVAMGVPCVWAAMGYSSSDYQRDPCCCCRKLGAIKKVADSDVASTASDSAKSDFISAHAKLHD